MVPCAQGTQSLNYWSSPYSETTAKTALPVGDLRPLSSPTFLQSRRRCVNTSLRKCQASRVILPPSTIAIVLPFPRNPKALGSQTDALSGAKQTSCLQPHGIRTSAKLCYFLLPGSHSPCPPGKRLQSKLSKHPTPPEPLLSCFGAPGVQAITFPSPPEWPAIAAVGPTGHGFHVTVSRISALWNLVP